MSDYTNFVTMGKAEAEALFQRFLSEMPASLEMLAEKWSANAGPREVELDFSPDSLEPLWEWARPRFAWREGYQPPDVGMPGPRIDPDRLEPPGDLPAWFHDVHGADEARFNAQTLWLIDGLGRYLGETLRRNFPSGRWAIGHSRTKGYLHQNQPVITGLGDDYNPLHSCAILVGRALQPRPTRGPQTLRDLYNVWTTGMPEQRS